MLTGLIVACNGLKLIDRLVTDYSKKIKTWWNCPERAFRLAYWMRCRNGVPAPTEVVERRAGSFRLKLSTDAFRGTYRHIFEPT